MSELESGAKIVHWVPEADLRNSHDGLAQLAKKSLKVNVNELKVGECVMFINASWTAFKVYCANNIILHYKHPEGHRLNARAVTTVPMFMRGREINYTKALRHEVLRTRYPNRSLSVLEAELNSQP